MLDIMNNNCFVYKWTHTPTRSWYIGSHTSQKAHPNNGYICSSKTVRELIKSNPKDWVRTTVATGDKQEMYQLETTILQTFDARRDERSYNRHNNHKGAYRGGWNKGLTGLQTAWNKGITGYLKGNQNAKGHTPWNKDKRITDPELLQRYRDGAIRRWTKAKYNIQGE